MLRIRLVTLAILCASTVAGCTTPGSRGGTAAGPQSTQITSIPQNWPYEQPMQIETELKKLHDQLGITAAQQPQWDAFTQQVAASSRQFHGTVNKLLQTDPQMRSFGTYHDLQQARMTVYDQVNPVYGRLYNVLSSSQQMQFNNLLIGPRTQMCGLLCQDGVTQ
jgi:protein CpxP